MHYQQQTRQEKAARGVEMVFVISSLSLSAVASCLTIPQQKWLGAHQEIALLKARALSYPLVTCNMDDPGTETLKNFTAFSSAACKNCFCGSFYARN
jgi:hypothetical protein